MNKAVDTFWTDSRLSSQRPAPRAITLPARGTADELSSVAAATRDLTKGNRLSVPSWAYFCMVVFATFAVCVTVTMRTHAERGVAVKKFEGVSAEVERLRETNDALRREAERLRTDPRAIEAAARVRLNMVRANEIVVPLN